jgi:Flp pilus assembly pilin Flp
MTAMARAGNTGVRPMNNDHRKARTGQLAAKSRPVVRLLKDETAATTTEYVIAGAALALAAIAAARVLTSVLTPYLHRIFLVVTLPIP